MPSVTPDSTLITCEWWGVNDAHEPSAGSISMHYLGPVRMDTDAAQPIPIFPVLQTKTLAPGTVTIGETEVTVGKVVFSFIASDDPDLEGSGWPVRIVETLTNSDKGRTFDCEIPFDAPGGTVLLHALSGSDPEPGEVYGAPAIRTSYNPGASGLPSTVRNVQAAIDEVARRTLPYTVADLYAETIEADTPKPIVMPHRGAGDRIAPENTLEAMRIGMGHGLGIIDGGDLYLPLGSSTDFLICHDDTVNNFTTATGNVADFDVNGWRNLTVDAGSWFGAGWGNLKPCTFTDVAREFGGRVVLMPEIKENSAAATAALIALIDRYNLADSVIVQSFHWDQVETAAAAGLHAMWIQSIDPTRTPSEMQAAGIEWIGLSTAVPDAAFTTFSSAGIKVAAWTLASHVQRDKYVGLGAKMLIAADPIYVTKDPSLYRVTKSPFKSGGWPTGLLSTSGSYQNVTPGQRGTITGGKHTQPVANNQCFLQGYACPLPDPSGSYQIDVDVTWTQLHSDTSRHIDIVVCCADDTPFTHQNTVGSYACVLRQSGAMAIFKRVGDGSGASSAATGSSSAITTPGTNTPLRVNVTPTSISLTRVDTGTTITANDTQHRGAYFHVGKDDSNTSTLEFGYSVEVS